MENNSNQPNPNQPLNQPLNSINSIVVPTPGQTPCSFHVCESGHAWPLTITVVGCDGCEAPIYALQASNCPVCNEPFALTRVRVDISSQAMAFPQLCQDQRGKGLSALIDIPREAWQEYTLARYSTPIIDKSVPKSKRPDHGKELSDLLEKEQENLNGSNLKSDSTSGDVRTPKTLILQSKD